MSKTIILIIGAVIFYIIRAVVKNTNQQNTQSQAPARQQNKTSNNKPKTTQEIYNEFIKEIEKQKQKQGQKNRPIPNANQQAQSTKSASTKKNVDWQQVETTHIAAKKQLINHDDYDKVSHRIDASHQIQEIAETEGEVFEFNKDNIDWKQAIISKEILDRKYA